MKRWIVTMKTVATAITGIAMRNFVPICWHVFCELI